MLNYSVFDRVLSKILFVGSFAIAGALLIQPLAFIVWAGMEHGGEVLVPVHAGVVGAVIGAAIGLIVLVLRYFYRRLFGARTA